MGATVDVLDVADGVPVVVGAGAVEDVVVVVEPQAARPTVMSAPTMNLRGNPITAPLLEMASAPADDTVRERDSETPSAFLSIGRPPAGGQQTSESTAPARPSSARRRNRQVRGRNFPQTASRVDLTRRRSGPLVSPETERSRW